MNKSGIVLRNESMPAPIEHVSFNQLERMAVAISKSGMFAVKTPEAALTLLLIAQSEGIPPTQAMMDYDVIQGKPALKAVAMLTRFQKSGGKVRWITSTDEVVEGHFSHPMGGELTVKWDDARLSKAGLSTKEMHKKFPLQMKRARCISEAIRAIAPGCVPAGIYTVEEARDMPDETVVETVPINQAVAEAAEQVTHQMDPERVDALITSLDVKTIGELIPAFGHAYTEARDAKDNAAMDRIKSAYETMKSALESEAI